MANVGGTVVSAETLVFALWVGVWGGKPTLGWLIVALMVFNIVMQGILLRANLRAALT